MTKAGLIAYLIIIGISHVCFGLFSTKHRFNKVITYIAYALFFGLFIGVAFLQLDFAWYFLIIFFIYMALYALLSEGKVITNMFLITSYLTFIIIFFGITFTLLFIEGPAAIPLRWILLLFFLGIMEGMMYGYLIPQFRKAQTKIKKGWTVLYIGDLLFTAILFMQIFWPFKLSPDNPGMIVLFTLSSLIYFFVFVLVLNGFGTAVSYTQEKEKNSQLESLAHRDGLTNLFNKNYFQEYSDVLISQYPSSGDQKAAVIVMDIDKFKAINDTYGHFKGDEVLKQVAQTILQVFKEDGFTCFRVGGDEFIIISIKHEQTFIKEKIKVLHQMLLEQIQVSISAGYCFVDFENIDPITTAFKNADKIMYQEKLN